jgi:hypothetical protein
LANSSNGSLPISYIICDCNPNHNMVSCICIQECERTCLYFEKYFQILTKLYKDNKDSKRIITTQKFLICVIQGPLNKQKKAQTSNDYNFTADVYILMILSLLNHTF